MSGLVTITTLLMASVGTCPVYPLFGVDSCSRNAGASYQPMSTGHRRPADTGTILRRDTRALVIALLVNLVLGWVALSQSLVELTECFRYPAIVVWTLLGIGGATAVCGVLARRSAVPDRTFFISAVVPRTFARPGHRTRAVWR